MEEDMIDAQSTRRRRILLVALVCLATMGLFGSASSALAVQSSQYDPFLQYPASCPTGSPYMNNPSFPEVACVTSTANHVALKLGTFETERDSSAFTGFALVFGDPTINTSCPAGECFDAVPGSTVFSDAPFEINFPSHGHGKPVHFPLTLHRPWHGVPWRHFVHLRKSLLFSPHDPSIEATIEAAGGIRRFQLNEGPLFELPIKIHLEGPLLGRDCYVGSDASPITLQPRLVSEPELAGLPDPNGLPVQMLRLTGMDLASTNFAVPAAQGCGPAIGVGKHKHYLLDPVINSALGLPSPAGANALLLNDSTTDLVLSPGGGGLLQVAFEAANAP